MQGASGVLTSVSKYFQGTNVRLIRQLKGNLPSKIWFDSFFGQIRVEFVLKIVFFPSNFFNDELYLELSVPFWTLRICK